MLVSFCIIFVHFLHHFGIILESFWDCFGVNLMPLGVIWRPGAPQGTPQGSRVEKVTKKLVRGSFVGPPLRPLLEPKSFTNRGKNAAETLLKNIVRKVLHKRSPGTSSNHENDGFAQAKPLVSNFHRYLQNDRKLFGPRHRDTKGRPFGYLFFTATGIPKDSRWEP